MKATLQLAVPNTMELDLRLSLTVDEARELANQLVTDKWPSWKLRAILADSIAAALKHFEGKHEVDP